MAKAEQYGNLYFCVETPLAEPGDGIYFYADRIEITPAGDLIAWREKAGGQINLALARGQWTLVRAASAIDGGAVAIEHWERPAPPWKQPVNKNQ